MSHGLILPGVNPEAQKRQALADELIADADASPGAYALAMVRMQETDCDAATAVAQVLSRRATPTVAALLSELADRMVYMAIASTSDRAMRSLTAQLQNPETWKDQTDDEAGEG